MNSSDYSALSKQLLDHAASVQASKRPEYTQLSADVLANFKNVGQRLGLAPGQVLLVYLEKHLDAIRTMLNDPTVPLSEPAIGRFGDAINYLQLAYALFMEAYDHRATAPEFIGRDH